VVAVGLSLGAIYWGLVLWRGGPPDELTSDEAATTPFTTVPVI
jgi:hypothetical protein